MTGPLLTPLPADQWGDDEYAAVGALFGISGDKVPRAGSGDPRDPMRFDILGVLARHPKMARVFMSYNAFLLPTWRVAAAAARAGDPPGGARSAIGVLLG